MILALGVVAFVVITSVIIFSIDWGGSDSPESNALRPVNISEYANTDVQVRMSARGEVNNNQEHQDLRITVGRNETVGELIDGYQGGVSRSAQTPNNPESYKTFLSALNNAGFTNIKLPPKGVQYDGVCPTGTRYTFEFIGGDERTPKPTWTTTCGKKIGTFNGNASLVQSLFEAQIPTEQFRTLTTGTAF